MARAVRAALDGASIGAAVTPHDRPELTRHGHLGPEAHARVVAEALRGVVAPAARVLLAA